jgi:biopolymer transport protein ExbD/biopolymer transport protein TolR
MAIGSLDRPKSGLYRQLAEINVTPLVDVMLVLLIIFMVTAPMLATGMKVDLPQARQATPLNPDEPIVITIGKDGQISLGSDAIDKAALIEAVRVKMGGDGSRVIHLRSDKEVRFADVVAVLDLLAANGLTKIAILTQAKKSDGPASPPPAPGTGADTQGPPPASGAVTNKP